MKNFLKKSIFLLLFFSFSANSVSFSDKEKSMIDDFVRKEAIDGGMQGFELKKSDVFFFDGNFGVRKYIVPVVFKSISGSDSIPAGCQLYFLDGKNHFVFDKDWVSLLKKDGGYFCLDFSFYLSLKEEKNKYLLIFSRKRDELLDGNDVFYEFLFLRQEEDGVCLLRNVSQEFTDSRIKNGVTKKATKKELEEFVHKVSMRSECVLPVSIETQPRFPQ